MYHFSINIVFITLFSNWIHCNVLKRNIITMSNTYIINSEEFESRYRNVTRSLCSIKLDRKPFSFRKQSGDACFTVNENGGGSGEKYILGQDNDWNTYIDPAWNDYLIYRTLNGDDVMFTDTTSATGLGDVVESITVVGGSVWKLYSRENFEGRHYMATEGEWTQFFGFTGEVAMAIERIGDTCASRPIGVQHPLIIPDSSLTVDDAHGGEDSIHQARLYFADDQAFGFDFDLDQDGGFYIRSPTYWGEAVIFSVDLGGLYRVYAVGTQQRRSYHTNVFNILYTPYDDPTISHMRYYQEDGSDKLFEVTRSDPDEAVVSSFAPPFLARHVAHYGKRGRILYSGLRLEYYGCAVEGDKLAYTKTNDVTCSDTNDVTTVSSLEEAQSICSSTVGCHGIAQSTDGSYTVKTSCTHAFASRNYVYIKQSHYEHVSSNDLIGDLTLLDDLDYNTCVTASQQINYLRHPVPAFITEETVTLTLHANTINPSSCDVTIHAFVHVANDVTSDSGLFISCDQMDTENSHLFVYSCSCAYGGCEYVFTRIEYGDQTNMGCFELCEVEFT